MSHFAWHIWKWEYVQIYEQWWWMLSGSWCCASTCYSCCFTKGKIPRCNAQCQASWQSAHIGWENAPWNMHCDVQVRLYFWMHVLCTVICCLNVKSRLKAFWKKKKKDAWSTLLKMMNKSKKAFFGFTRRSQRNRLLQLFSALQPHLTAWCILRCWTKEPVSLWEVQLDWKFNAARNMGDPDIKLYWSSSFFRDTERHLNQTSKESLSHLQPLYMPWLA